MCGIRIAAAAATDVFPWHRLEGQPHHLPLGCGRTSLQRGRVNMIRGIRLRQCAFISGPHHALDKGQGSGWYNNESSLSLTVTPFKINRTKDETSKKLPFNSRSFLRRPKR